MEPPEVESKTTVASDQEWACQVLNKELASIQVFNFNVSSSLMKDSSMVANHSHSLGSSEDNNLFRNSSLVGNRALISASGIRSWDKEVSEFHNNSNSNDRSYSHNKAHSLGHKDHSLVSKALALVLETRNFSNSSLVRNNSGSHSV